MYIEVPSACSTGEYYHHAKGCQLCSLVHNSYQEVLCPCEAARDAVISCKLSSSINNLCRPRSAAVDECARRGYTSSVAPRTTASAGITSTALVTAASTSSAAVAVESTQWHFTSISNALADGSRHSALPDGSFILILSLIACLSMIIILSFMMMVVWRRRLVKCIGRNPPVFVDEGRTASAKQSAVEISTPTMIAFNGAAQSVNPNPSAIVNNYRVVVKNSQFTQVGSHNVISVGEQVASAIGIANVPNCEDEEHSFSSGGPGARDDGNVGDLDSSFSRCTNRDGDFSYWLGEELPQSAYPLLAPGGTVDGSDDGGASPCSFAKSDAVGIRTQSLVSRGLSADRPGEEQRRSAAGPEPADGVAVPQESGIAGLLQHREGLPDSPNGGCQGATAEDSHLPTEITDNCSQAIDPSSAKMSPATRATGGAGSSSISRKPLLSPRRNDCHIPSVSNLRADDAIAPHAHTSASLPNSGHVSQDCGDENERLLMHPGPEQTPSTVKPGVLSSSRELPADGVPSPVENLDDDPNLPNQTERLLQPLSVIRVH